LVCGTTSASRARSTTLSSDGHWTSG
jgi:hypothetical protein